MLILIHEGKGKNDLVETKRGKQFRGLDLPVDLTRPDPEPVTKLTEELMDDEGSSVCLADMYEETMI